MIEGFLFFGLAMFIAMASFLPLVIVYFLPFIIAYVRGAEHRWWILGLNIFLGATGIVWLVLIVWSFMDKVDAAAQTCCNCKCNAGTDNP